MLVLAIAGGQLALWSSTRLGFWQTTTGASELTLARGWYALIGQPLFLFFFARWIWRWAVWCALLRRWARM
jgi:hypothetical protein